jgi:iodotyrosine deiodinase
MSRKMQQTHPLHFIEKPEDEMAKNAASFLELMKKRRSVRDFSSKPVPRELIEQAIKTAALAPSGANQQPWFFAVISNPEHKQQLREAAEIEEKAFYAGRAGGEWLDALAHLGTDWQKPFLTDAPYIVVLFGQRYGLENGKKIKHYYVPESVGIAAGFFIAALHNMGLATLTHTPSPMGFLNELCKRDDNEKPYILFPVGYPKDDCQVPTITKKTLSEVSKWL